MKKIDVFLSQGVKIMQWSIYQIIIAALLTNMSFAFNVWGQELLDRRISVEAVNQKINTVLSGIEKNAEVKFSYSPNLIQANRKVTFQVSNEKLSVILEKLLAPYDLRYEVIGKQIVLKRKLPDQHKKSGETNRPNQPQQTDMLITGSVTDKTGLGLPGVSILVKGTQNGTTTDVEGKYRIDVQDNAAVLVFSFVGFVSQKMQVESRTVINIELQADEKELDEVVVVAFGTQKKASVTGAVSSVYTKDIKQSPAANLAVTLAGRLPGLTAIQSNGEPGRDITQLLSEDKVPLTRRAQSYLLTG